MAIKIESKIVGWKVVKENVATGEKVEEVLAEPPKLKRPDVLHGKTYKLKNMNDNYNLYVTINRLEDGKPIEIFFSSSHQESNQWATALSRLSSALLRSYDSSFSLEFLAKELCMIYSDKGYFAGSKYKYVSGIVQHIGKLLLDIAKEDKKALKNNTPAVEEKVEEIEATGTQCPECGEMTLIKEGGCTRCTNSECGYMGECG